MTKKCRENNTKYCFSGLCVWRQVWSPSSCCPSLNLAKLGAWICNLGTSNECCTWVELIRNTLFVYSRQIYFFSDFSHCCQIMYFGSGSSRDIIKKYEFYYSKDNPKKLKKNKSSSSNDEKKQSRIKFDVLLTSYEMINMDSAVLKTIEWECMVILFLHFVEAICTLMFLLTCRWLLMLHLRLWMRGTAWRTKIQSCLVYLKIIILNIVFS